MCETDNSRRGCWVRLKTEAGLSKDTGAQDYYALQRHLCAGRQREASRT